LHPLQLLQDGEGKGIRQLRNVKEKNDRRKPQRQSVKPFLAVVLKAPLIQGMRGAFFEIQLCKLTKLPTAFFVLVHKNPPPSLFLPKWP